jgi:hypothetical protein
MSADFVPELRAASLRIGLAQRLAWASRRAAQRENGTPKSCLFALKNGPLRRLASIANPAVDGI